MWEIQFHACSNHIYRNLTLKQQGEIKSKVKFEFVYSSSIRLKNDRGYGIFYDTKF